MSKKRRTISAEFKLKIVLETLKGQRMIKEIASEYEVHPNQITKWKKQFYENGPSLFSLEKNTKIDKPDENEVKFYKKIEEQQKVINSLRESLVKYPVKQKRQLIEPNNKKISIKKQCDLLELTRSAYYYSPKKISPLNVKLMKIIKEIIIKNPKYGSRTIVDIILRQEGIKVNRKRIQRLLKLIDK